MFKPISPFFFLLLKLEVLKLFSASHIYLIRTGGLVGAVVITEVLVSFSRLRLSIYACMRLIDGRDIVTQGDGLYSLVDATADTLTDFGA